MAKKKNKKKRGFTLIEILVAIVIIGTLASIILVKISSSRDKTTIAAYKSTVASLVPAVTVCCDMPTNILQTTAGEDICNPQERILLPTAAQMKADAVLYAVTAQCNAANPSLRVTPAGLPIEACNAAVNITASGVNAGGTIGFPAGC